jgi:methanogenic corrinoid protein MtbC1
MVMPKKLTKSFKDQVMLELSKIKGELKDTLVEGSLLLEELSDSMVKFEEASKSADKKISQIIEKYETIARRLDRLNDTVVDYFEEEDIGEIEE